MEKDIVDLYELQTRLKEGVERTFPEKVWLKAEISAVKARPGGHCYLELSQSGDGGLVAKAQAIIWSSKYRILSPFFESVAGSPISEGMLVLVRVQVNFSQLYGLSLIIDDIDPSWSLGEKEKERLRTIARLKEEGLMGLQKELALPSLPYRLAVVSAPDAAGYRDFMRHLHENDYGFVFSTELFPALMQGAGAAVSMSAAIDAAEASGEKFDALLILRGGGAKLDLACYDDYVLASRIARCSLPVLTAVGHDQDVACVRYGGVDFSEDADGSCRLVHRPVCGRRRDAPVFCLKAQDGFPEQDNGDGEPSAAAGDPDKVGGSSEYTAQGVCAGA